MHSWILYEKTWVWIEGWTVPCSWHKQEYYYVKRCTCDFYSFVVFFEFWKQKVFILEVHLARLEAKFDICGRSQEAVTIEFVTSDQLSPSVWIKNFKMPCNSKIQNKFCCDFLLLLSLAVHIATSISWRNLCPCKSSIIVLKLSSIKASSFTVASCHWPTEELRWLKTLQKSVMMVDGRDACRMGIQWWIPPPPYANLPFSYHCYYFCRVSHPSSHWKMEGDDAADEDEDETYFLRWT